MFLTCCTSNWYCVESSSRVTYLVSFSGNITSCACLDKSGLKVIFHLFAQFEFFSDLYLTDQPTYCGHRQLETVKCHLQRV